MVASGKPVETSNFLAILSKAVLKNENFCLSTRQVSIITAGIYFIF